MTQTQHLRLVTPPSTRQARISTAQWITLAVTALCVFGLVMVGSASSVISMTLYGSPWAIFLRQLIWVIIGIAGFYVAGRIDLQRWRRWIPYALGGSFLMLLFAVTPGLGQSSGGSSRWIGYGLLRIQPSEFMKLALALYVADFVAKRQEKGVELKRILGPITMVTGCAVLLLLAQPDLGTAMVLMVILLSMLVAADVPTMVLLKGMALVTVLVTVMSFAAPYRVARLTSFVNPWAHASTTGYQVVQSLIGLGSGHLVGLGLGNSREKWGLLPNAHTDFIASVIGEELGLVGVVFILLLVGFLIAKGLRAATEAPDRFSAYLGVGLITWIGAEAIINIGAAFGVLPVTGIPLPFVSFGGSSLMITMCAAGLLVNIARLGTPAAVGLRRSTRSTTKATTASAAKKSSRNASSSKDAAPRKATASATAKRRTAAKATAPKRSPRTSSSPSPRSHVAKAAPAAKRSSARGTSRSSASSTPRQRKVR